MFNLTISIVMKREEYIQSIVEKLTSCAHNVCADPVFKARLDTVCGKALDVLGKPRPDDRYVESNVAVAIYGGAAMGVWMREGPNNRCKAINHELIAAMLKRFPEFADGMSSFLTYFDAFYKYNRKTFLDAGADEHTQEEGKAKSFSVWSLMWLGHQLSFGCLKSEAMEPVVMCCVESSYAFDAFFRSVLSSMFGPAVETHTPMPSGKGSSSATGCLIAMMAMFGLVGAVVACVSSMASN